MNYEYLIINAIAFIFILLTNILKDNWHHLGLITLLGSSLFFEIVLSFLENKIHGSNYITYSVYGQFCILIYVLIYSNSIKTINLYERLFAFLAVLIAGGVSLYTNKLFTFLYFIGMFYTLMLVIIYWVKSFENISTKWFHDYKLVLSIGIVIYFVCSFPILCFLNTFITEYSEITLAEREAYGDILGIGNIFLSLGYLGGAIVLCLQK